jgi:hypothetical protein
MFESKKITDPATRTMQYFPFDPANQRVYRKIVGGFVSPGPAEGAVMICGLEYAWRPPAAIYLLNEFLSSQPEALILKAIEAKSTFKAGEIFTYNDSNFLRYLETRNASARDRKLATLDLHQAPNADSDNISYHIHLLVSLLRSGSKKLILGYSDIVAALQAVPQAEIATATARQHFLVAALGYAVAALEVFYPQYGFDDRPKNAKVEYDVGNYMP